jgi:hypothetical protein
VQRYVDLFQGKLEHRAAVPKKTADRQHLIKLQCYTQKILPVALPTTFTNFVFCIPVNSVIKSSYFIADSQFVGPPSPDHQSPRGPPSLNS